MTIAEEQVVALCVRRVRLIQLLVPLPRLKSRVHHGRSEGRVRRFNWKIARTGSSPKRPCVRHGIHVAGRHHFRLPRNPLRAGTPTASPPFTQSRRHPCPAVPAVANYAVRIIGVTGPPDRAFRWRYRVRDPKHRHAIPAHIGWAMPGAVCPTEGIILTKLIHPPLMSCPIPTRRVVMCVGDIHYQRKPNLPQVVLRSEEHTSELQSL